MAESFREWFKRTHFDEDWKLGEHGEPLSAAMERLAEDLIQYVEEGMRDGQDND